MFEWSNGGAWCGIQKDLEAANAGKTRPSGGVDGRIARLNAALFVKFIVERKNPFRGVTLAA
jgi:hypothetical protein